MSDNLPVPQSSNGNLATVTVSHIAKSLAVAQQKCRSVAKDSKNKFHNYKYASAEAIITEGKNALAETGLALLPVEQTLNGFSPTGEGRFELVRKFLLLDASGEKLPLMVCWPVVPEKGRPLDKATAIAATLSLAYLLRDLLLMPRVNPDDDLAGRQDEPHHETESSTRPQAPEGQAATADEESPRINEEQQQELNSLIRETGTDTSKILDHYKVKGLIKLTVQQFNDLRGILLDRKAQAAKAAAAPTTNGTPPAQATSPSTPATLAANGQPGAGRSALCDRIDALVEELQIPQVEFSDRMKQLFNTDDLTKLDVVQLGKLVARLEDYKAKRGAPVETPAPSKS